MGSEAKSDNRIINVGDYYPDFWRANMTKAIKIVRREPGYLKGVPPTVIKVIKTKGFDSENYNQSEWAAWKADVAAAWELANSLNAAKAERRVA